MSLFGMWREETVSKRSLPGCRAQGIMGRPPCSSLSCCSQTAQSFRVTLLCYQSMNLSFISPTYFRASAAVSAPHCLPVNLLCLCFHRWVTEALCKKKEALIASVSSTEQSRFGSDSFSFLKTLLFLQVFFIFHCMLVSVSLLHIYTSILLSLFHL